MCELYSVPLLLIFLFVDCYYNNSILWSKYPKNLWRWPPSSSLPPHLQSQLPLPLCLFTTAEPWQQRHRGYYGCYNVKVDRKVASPVLFFFFVYALCVIYVQGFFSAVSSRSSSRSKQAAATSQTGLAFHSTTPYYGDDDDGLLRFVFFCIIPTIITPPVYGSGGCSGPGLTDGWLRDWLCWVRYSFTLLLLLFFVLLFFRNLLWWQKVTRDPKAANHGQRRSGCTATTTKTR